MCVGVALEKQCHQLMMMKFGRLVDLEALQTLSGNRTLEELKQEKLLREAAYAKEIQQWDVRWPVCVCVCAWQCSQVWAFCTSARFVLNLLKMKTYLQKKKNNSNLKFMNLFSEFVCVCFSGEGRRGASGSDGGDQA